MCGLPLLLSCAGAECGTQGWRELQHHSGCGTRESSQHQQHSAPQHIYLNWEVSTIIWQLPYEDNIQ